MKAKYQSFALLLICFFIQFSSSGQELWGLTKRGGKYDKGVIFKMDKDANNQEVVFSFEAMGLPESNMTEYSEGVFYGTTTNAFEHGKGGIFKFESATGVFTKMIDFEKAAGGADGAGSLILASNGKFYGMTQTGGTFDDGIIYEFDPVTKNFSVRINFEGSIKGKRPVGALTEGTDGNLYGMASQGGEYDSGVIFRYDFVTNSFTKLIDFNGSDMGSAPGGGLILASDSMYYGTTREGGKDDYGLIFRFDPETRQYDVLFEFDGRNNGSHPECTLLEGFNGNLYGTASSGGLTNNGLIFEFDYAEGVFIKRLENSGSFGDKINGSLVEAPNRKIYGTYYNSDFQDLRIIECDPELGMFRDIIGYADDLRYGENCAESITIGSNGKIYFWGRDNFYVDKEVFMFEYDYEKDKVSNYYKNQTSQTGSYPSGDLVQAANKNLYGIGSRGGSYDLGVLFEFNPDEGIYGKMVDFDNQQKGSVPLNNPILINDSLLFGMASKGGIYDKGVLYKFNTASKTFTKIIDFDGEDKGANPHGRLLLASNGLIYGVTTFGGLYDSGVLFEFDAETSAFEKIIDFEESKTGKHPYGSLIQASGGKLYGTALIEGSDKNGILFEFDFESGELIKKIELYAPFELMQASNNNLYISGYSSAYEFNPVTGALRILDLNTVDGVVGRLFEYAPGRLLGMNYGELWYLGGSNTNGNIFEYDLTTDISTLKVEFDGSSGRHPDNSGFIKAGIQTGPVAACKPYTLYLNEEGMAHLLPEDVDDGSSGNDLIFSLNKDSFGCEDLGENYVIFTVTDENGFSAACNALINVVDTIPPVVICRDVEVFLDADGVAMIEAADIDAGSHDVCGIAAMELNINSFSWENLGENMVELIVTDHNGNSSVCSAAITVRDTIAPEIACVANMQWYLEPYEEQYFIDENDWKATATDNGMVDSIWYSFTGAKTAGITAYGDVVLVPGIYEIEWTVVDLSGNLSSCNSEVTIERRPASLVVVENEIVAGQGVLQFKGLLMDDLLVEGIKGKQVLISAGNFSEVYHTNEEGIVRAEIPVDEEAANFVTVTAQFEEDATYAGCYLETQIVTSVDLKALAEIKVYPNPFVQKLNIEFVSPQTADARIDIFDSAGRLVKTILNQQVIKGSFYKTEFVPQNETGALFLYRFAVGSYIYSGKITYQK